MPITFKEYALVCAAAYNTAALDSGDKFGVSFTRVGGMATGRSGFQGAIYQRTVSGRGEWVVGIAGTQPGEGGGVDLVADAGFGGRRIGAIPPLRIIAIAGNVLLETQIKRATELLARARSLMKRGDSLSITGHSLGGGIAQIVAARAGVAAMGFNPPAVTAVPGVKEAYARTRPPITNLKVKNDPINLTTALGDWLGRVEVLPSPRTGGEAHSIALTAGELAPTGAFAAFGARDPFAA